MSTHKLLTPQQVSRRIGFGKKTKTFPYAKKFWTFSVILEKKSHVKIQAGSIVPLKIYLLFIGSITVTPDKSMRQLFWKKKLSPIRRKLNGQSSNLVSIMKGVTAVFYPWRSVVLNFLSLQAKQSLLLSKLRATVSKTGVCLRTRRNIFALFFSLSSVPVHWIFCECSWDLSTITWQLLEHFMSK